MFTKFEVKYGAQSRYTQRDPPPGRKYDFLVPSSYFFRFHKAPRVKYGDGPMASGGRRRNHAAKREAREERRELCSGNFACKSRKSRNFPCVTRVFVRQRRLNATFIESVNQVWQISCRCLAMAWTLELRLDSQFISRYKFWTLTNKLAKQVILKKNARLSSFSPLVVEFDNSYLCRFIIDIRLYI